MLADYHIHSEYSDDSEEKMETIIESAVSKNINEICFTDHVDYGIKIDHDVFKQLNDEEKLNAIFFIKKSTTNFPHIKCGVLYSN